MFLVNAATSEVLNKLTINGDESDKKVGSF